MQHYLLMSIAILMQTTNQVGGDSYLIQTAIANGGIGAILFVIWFITFKHLQRQFQFALKQNQDQQAIALKQNQDQLAIALKQNQDQLSISLAQNQHQFAISMKQNQDQFDTALLQIKEQHTDNLGEQRRINDRLFDVISKDGEYKEILTGVLTEMKNQISKINC